MINSKSSTKEILEFAKKNGVVVVKANKVSHFDKGRIAYSMGGKHHGPALTKSELIKAIEGAILDKTIAQLENN